MTTDNVLGNIASCLQIKSIGHHAQEVVLFGAGCRI